MKGLKLEGLVYLYNHPSKQFSSYARMGNELTSTMGVNESSARTQL